MLDRSELIPMIQTSAPVGTDVSNPEAQTDDKPTTDDNEESRPVERFLVAGWRAQLEKAKTEYKANAGQEAFFESLELLTFGAWGHFNDNTLAVYAENESVARSYVAIAFDLMVRGLVVRKYSGGKKNERKKK